MLATRLIQALLPALLVTFSIAQDCSLNEIEQVVASAPVPNAGLGGALDISGNHMVAGAAGEDHSGFSNAGAAYVFEDVDGSWVQRGRFVLEDPAQGDLFGLSVTIDGDTLVIGGSSAGTFGRVEVYRRISGVWTHEASLQPDNPVAGQRLGSELDLEGDLLAVGANGDERVYVFRRSGTTWSEVTSATRTNLWRDVAISGDTLLCGSPQGAYVFRLVNDQLVEEALLSPGASTPQEFAYALDIDGDRALVGDVGVSGGGAVFFFKRTGTSWTSGAKKQPPLVEDLDVFGQSVVLLGDRAYVGCIKDDIPFHGQGGGVAFKAGSVYEYVHNGSKWSEAKRLYVSNGAGQDWMGNAVAFDGGVLAAGAARASAGPGFARAGRIMIFDPTIPCVDRYCIGGISASGCQAHVESFGLPSASATSGFDVTAWNVESQKDGLFFYGTRGRASNPWGNSSSTKCVLPPTKRSSLLSTFGTPGTCEGFVRFDLNQQFANVPAHNPGSGAVMQVQFWYRDPLNPSNQTTSLSDALEFTVQP